MKLTRRPTPLEILEGVQRSLAIQVVPELTSDQARAELGSAVGLLGYLARDFDGAAQSLLEEIADLQQVATQVAAAFRAAGHSEEATDLEVTDPPVDVRVSTLFARHDELQQALLAALLAADHAIEDRAASGDAGGLEDARAAIRAAFVRLNGRRFG